VAHLAADHDHASAAAGVHERAGGMLQGEEAGPDVERVDPVERRGRHVQERRGLVAAGGVDDDLVRAERRERACQALVVERVVAHRDVAGARDRRHARARVCERLGAGRADAFAGADHEGAGVDHRRRLLVTQ
jgi:hypothetical protein